MKTFLDRIGVCSWSLQPRDLENLFSDLEYLRMQRVQIDLDAIRRDPALWKLDAVSSEKIHVISGMFRCVGEDYSTLESIRRTGGLLPDETWQDTWEIAQASADVAQKLGIRLVSFHAGFIPPDPANPVFEKLLHRVRLVADFFASRNVEIALETGQETALTLKTFLEQLGRTNVGVNFDPANLLINDMGDPIEALTVLKSWIKQCHVKDGIRPQQHGDKGAEAVVGTGEVAWENFFRTLREIEFPGYLFIEREAGTNRRNDIQTARQFLARLESK